MATITKTIGTDAREYSTITLWEAAITANDDSSGSYIARGECYNDSAFDETVTLDDTSPDLGTELSVAVGERHDGTDGSGARIVRTGDGGIVFSPAEKFTLDWLEIDLNSNSFLVSIGLVYCSEVTSNANRPVIRWVLLHGGLVNVSSSLYGIRLRVGASILNTMVYDMEQSTSISGGDVLGIVTGSTARTLEILNTTAHDIRLTGASNTGDCIGIYLPGDDADFTVQNCVVTDLTGTTTGAIECYNSDGFSTATVDHNLASDTTSSGTGSLESKTSADQFVSNSAPYDLHIKTGADAIDAGVDLVTTPSGVEIDIDARDRDAEADTWDMGAHEFVGAPAAGNRRRRMMLFGAGA